MGASPLGQVSYAFGRLPEVDDISRAVASGPLPKILGVEVTSSPSENLAGATSWSLRMQSSGGEDDGRSLADAGLIKVGL